MLSSVPKLRHKKKCLPVMTRGENDALRRYQLSASNEMRGIGDVDPVYLLSKGFAQSFDAIGNNRARRMASGGETESDAEERHLSETSGGEKNHEEKLADLRERHDYPEYSHSKEELNGGRFIDKFSGYAFRGGRLAGAVLDGTAKTMFITCIKRSIGLPNPDLDRQRKLIGQNALSFDAYNMPATRKAVLLQ